MDIDLVEGGQPKTEVMQAKAKAVHDLVAQLNLAIYDANKVGLDVAVETHDITRLGGPEGVKVSAKVSLSM